MLFGAQEVYHTTYDPLRVIFNIEQSQQMLCCDDKFPKLEQVTCLNIKNKLAKSIQKGVNDALEDTHVAFDFKCEDCKAEDPQQTDTYANFSDIVIICFRRNEYDEEKEQDIKHQEPITPSPIIFIGSHDYVLTSIINHI